MAYMCVLNHTEECNGCQECERQRKSKEQLRWEKYEEEYDRYRDAEYENIRRFAESKRTNKNDGH